MEFNIPVSNFASYHLEAHIKTQNTQACTLTNMRFTVKSNCVREWTVCVDGKAKPYSPFYPTRAMQISKIM